MVCRVLILTSLFILFLIPSVSGETLIFNSTEDSGWNVTLFQAVTDRDENLTTDLDITTGILSEAISMWRFNSSNTTHILDDNTTTGNDLIISGSTETIGPWGNGRLYDGINDYDYVPDPDTLDFGETNFSFSLWYKTDFDFTSTEAIITKKETLATSKAGFAVAVFSSENFAIYISNGTDGINRGVGTVQNDGIWHQLVVVVDRSGGTVLGYTDAVASTPGDISTVTGSISNSRKFEIGAMSDNGRWWNGSIDEVLIYNRTLSASEVLDIFNNSNYSSSNITTTLRDAGLGNVTLNVSCLGYIPAGSSVNILLNSSSDESDWNLSLVKSGASCDGTQYIPTNVNRYWNYTFELFGVPSIGSITVEEGSLITPPIATTHTMIFGSQGRPPTFLTFAGNFSFDHSILTNLNWASAGHTIDDNFDINSNNIINVADIALDTLSSDAGTSITVTLGTDAGDDFIVGNNNAFVVEGDNDRTAFGFGAPLGKVHIYSGASGQGSVDGKADELVIENSNHAGIIILTPNDKAATIFFGDPESNLIGRVEYDHNFDRLELWAGGTEVVRIFSTFVSFQEKDITNVGDIALDSISADAGSLITINNNVNLADEKVLRLAKTLTSSLYVDLYSPNSGILRLENLANKNVGLSFNNNAGVITSLQIDAGSTELEISRASDNQINFYRLAGPGENLELRLYGNPTGGASGYGSLQMVNTATDFQISSNRTGSDILLNPTNNVRIPADNKAMVWGASENVEAYYDNTDFIINPDAVGAGRVIIDGGMNITEDLNVTGNVIASNLFIPQYIFPHTDETIQLDTANVWKNVSFSQEDTAIKFGIGHSFNDASNTTFNITESGIYNINYNFDVIDTSVGASDVDVAGRAIYINGTEILGSVFEKDIIKQGVEAELVHTFLAGLNAGDRIIFQFIASDVDIQISTHGTFGDHPDSASIIIQKISNI